MYTQGDFLKTRKGVITQISGIRANTQTKEIEYRVETYEGNKRNVAWLSENELNQKFQRA